MKQQIINCSNLRKRYGRNEVLKNVSIHVPKGNIYGFVGENGAGKSTTLRIIAGLSKPDSGNIELFGRNNPKELRKMRSKIGFLIESPVLYGQMTAIENLEVQCLQTGVSNDNIIKILETVKLHDTEKVKVKNFSMGMKQRLGIAITLLGNPEVIILDEPVNGLDPTGVIDFRNFILEINRQGITVIISSHILKELYEIATCYGFIKNGIMVKEIEKQKLDSELDRHICVKTNQTKVAIEVLKNRIPTISVKQKGQNEIRICSHFNELANISSILYQTLGNGIEEINMQKENLEEYYIQVMEGSK